MQERKHDMSSEDVLTTEKEVNPSILDIICEPWAWDHEAVSEFGFRFFKDGTGEILGIGPLGMGWLFSMTTTWRSLPLSRTVQDIMKDNLYKHRNPLTKAPELLGCLQLEIKADNVMPKRYESRFTNPSIKGKPTCNDRMLDQIAYEPRSFIVVIEKGNFEAGYRQRYPLRMTFDVSPFPPLEAFKRDTGGPGADETSAWLNATRSLYAGKLDQRVAGKDRATNDDRMPVLGYHTSNCTVS